MLNARRGQAEACTASGWRSGFVSGERDFAGVDQFARGSLVVGGDELIGSGVLLGDMPFTPGVNSDAGSLSAGGLVLDELDEEAFVVGGFDNFHGSAWREGLESSSSRGQRLSIVRAFMHGKIRGWVNAGFRGGGGTVVVKRLRFAGNRYSAVIAETIQGE